MSKGVFSFGVLQDVCMVFITYVVFLSFSHQEGLHPVTDLRVTADLELVANDCKGP